MEEVRAFSFQSFIGNAGGYIGLFLGYALLHLPDLILFLYEKFSPMFIAFLNRQRIVGVNKSIVYNVGDKRKKEVVPQATNSENCETTSKTNDNTNTDGLRQVQRRMNTIEEDISMLKQQLQCTHCKNNADR